MAKSHTRKKSKHHKKVMVDSTAVDFLVNEIDSAVEYIKKWKQRELKKLITHSTSKNLVCLPVNDNNIILGKHGIKKHTHGWSLYDYRFDKELHFSSRTSALVYSLCHQKGYVTLADTVASKDTKLLKLCEDYNHCEYMKHRFQKKDLWKYDFYSILSWNLKYKIIEAKKQLEKSLDQAKYTKIWE